MARSPSLPGRLSQWILRFTGSIGLGLGIMTRREKRRAAALMVTTVVNGILQTAALIGVVALVRWASNPAQILPGWLARPVAQIFGEIDHAVLALVLAGGLTILVIGKTAFSWMQTGWMANFSASCENRLSTFLMRRVLFAHYSWLVRQNSARLRQLLFGFVSVWSRDFIRAIMRLMNDLMMAAFMVAALIASQPVAGLTVAFLGAAIGAVTFMNVRPRLNRFAKEKRRGILGANSVSTECILGAKDVKMASAEERFTNLFDEQVRIYAMADAGSQQWSQFPRHVLELVAYGALIAAGTYITLSPARDSDFTGLLLLYALAAIRLMPVMSTVVSSLSTLVNTFPVISDLQRLIDDTANPEIEPAEPTAEEPWHEARLEDVSMRYGSSKRMALCEVSVALQPGKMYGCVGQSGAGKSTFIDVLTGLLEPTEGALIVDNRRLDAAARRQWRKRFAYVAQKPFLLDAPLKENITFEGGIPDPARLQQVIGLARLEQVVARLPEGVDAPLGEQGAFLSGGERQRVAIARALYRGAELIIFDEATSSLDVLVEREIAETLANLRGKVTLIIVSHRLAFVRDADEIWIFEDGRMTGKGPHRDLMRSSDLYRRMIMQTAGVAAGTRA